MQKNPWTIENTRQIYNIAEWSEGYFDVSEQGHLMAFPNGVKQNHGIDLVELTSRIQQEGLRLPVLVRFTDILKNRLKALQLAFTQTMQQQYYQANYTAVYPIKVNQQRHVILKLLEQGGENFGLEAGSKPELMAVLSLLTDGPRTIVCNGYKDRDYIRLALIAQQLDHSVYLIIEKFSELNLIFEQAQELNVIPKLGVRVRLASIGKGKWQNTGGEKSKFGLTASQVLELLNQLKAKNYLSYLNVVHFHLGSQIANIRDIQRGLKECARFYAELMKYGAHIRCVDVGGGLGIDYEGTHSRSFCSINYTVAEYAKTVVHAFAEVCKQENLVVPDIITESGRALTAHHAMLITNLVEVEHPFDHLPSDATEENTSTILHDLQYSYQHVTQRNILETYHEICHALNEVQQGFNHGGMSLEQRAHAERYYLLTCAKIQQLLQNMPLGRAQQEILAELNEKLADKYFVNLSLFQSLPDVWAIDQIFPILPLNHLNIAPTRRGILQDLTCDSDGCIDYYVDGQGLESTLPLAPVNKNEPYLLGIFLVGAYQEILGDIHNLFGDTDSVHVEYIDEKNYQLVQPLMGDRICDVLKSVQFSAEQMLAAYAKQCDQIHCDAEMKTKILAELAANLQAYTYLNLPN